MADFSTAMTALTGTITARVMTTLGLGFLSYESIKEVANTVQSQLLSSYGGISSTMFGLDNGVG